MRLRLSATPEIHGYFASVIRTRTQLIPPRRYVIALRVHLFKKSLQESVSEQTASCACPRYLVASDSWDRRSVFSELHTR